MLRDEWLRDIDSCERGEGFDYGAARRVVCSYAAGLRHAWQGKPNPLSIEPGAAEDDSGESITAYLYIRDSWCDLESPVNLDGMPESELAEFIKAYGRAGKVRAARLFPERPAGYVAATGALVDYARRKRDAMTERTAGRINIALAYEAGADRVYASLPPFARW